MNDEPIPESVIQKARRRLCRHIAAVIIRCMADTDSDFAFIGRRIRKSEEAVRGWLYRLADGKSVSLDCVSDMLIAMGAELTMRVVPSPLLNDAPEARSEAGIPVTEQHQEVTEAA